MCQQNIPFQPRLGKAGRQQGRTALTDMTSTSRAQAADIIRCPYDGQEVGRMQIATEDSVEDAIRTAERGFGTMRRLPRFVRAEILERAAGIIDAEHEEFVRLIAAEAGKPLYDARGEVSRAVFNLRNAAAEARAWSGHEVPLDIDSSVFEYQTTATDGSALDLSKTDLDSLGKLGRRIGIARRFPVGPVLAITPFNFPLNLVIHKVAPAIAVGCSIVLKPAPQTPLTSARLAEILVRAGLPEDAISVVHCGPEMVNEWFVIRAWPWSRSPAARQSAGTSSLWRARRRSRSNSAATGPSLWPKMPISTMRPQGACAVAWSMAASIASGCSASLSTKADMTTSGKGCCPKSPHAMSAIRLRKGAMWGRSS